MILNALGCLRANSKHNKALQGKKLRYAYLWFAALTLPQISYTTFFP